MAENSLICRMGDVAGDSTCRLRVFVVNTYPSIYLFDVGRQGEGGGEIEGGRRDQQAVPGSQRHSGGRRRFFGGKGWIPERYEIFELLFH
jgi:hypothetical protein